MKGPGKYDGACTLAREMAKTEGAVLIIFNGCAGQGFSAQLPSHLLASLPRVLRDMADQIEADMKNHT